MRAMNNESRAIFQVLSAQFALESLRAKDIARALEILELQLDEGVLRLHALIQEGDPSERESIVAVLRQVRGYRQSHPRRVESDLSTVANGVLTRAVRVSKERVREILDQAK